MVNQQFCGGVDDFGLGLEQFVFEVGDDELVMCLWLVGIDWWVGVVEGVEQFVVEFVDEILKVQGQRGRFCVEQFVLYGCGFSGIGFEIEGYGDVLKKKGYVLFLVGQWYVLWWEVN